MAKRKKKPSKKAQTEIAEAVSEQQQRLKLQRQIKTLKRLPEDFRDITLGTDWEAFAKITGRRKEMDDWDHGPIMYLAPLNDHERMIMGSPNKLMAIKTEVSTWSDGCSSKVMFATPTTASATFNSKTWHNILSWAEKNLVSWIYLPDEETKVIEALNVLFSRLGLNVRAKGRLMSEFSGQPVGVVY